MSIPVLNYNFFSGQRTENYAVFSSQSVNLLQIVNYYYHNCYGESWDSSCEK